MVKATYDGLRERLAAVFVSCLLCVPPDTIQAGGNVHVDDLGKFLANCLVNVFGILLVRLWAVSCVPPPDVIGLWSFLV